MRTLRIALAALLLPLAGIAGPDKSAAPATVKKDAAFCDMLATYTKEAASEFKSLQGAPAAKAGNFKATKMLPAAVDCVVFSKNEKREAFLSCDLVETKDADIAAVTFKTVKEKVRACIAGSDWKVSEGEHGDGEGFWWSLERGENEPFYEVNHDIDGANHSVAVDVVQPD